MNWARIWTGGLLGALVGLIVDVIQARFFVIGDEAKLSDLWQLSKSGLLPDFILALCLSWLYVLVRPRLGPGPKSALVVSLVAFGIEQHHLLSPVALSQFSQALSLGVVAWVKLFAMTYVAGWQYIEKAPE